MKQTTNSTMNCKTFQEELMDLVLTADAVPSVAAAAHMKVCPPCTSEYLSFQQTFSLLDTWTAPEPSPYFDQKLSVRVREVQAEPQMGWFERLATRLQLNTGAAFRPAMAGALALAMLVAGGSYAGLSGGHLLQPVAASATVNDLQILDRNEQAFQQMDALQADDESPSQGVDESPASPTS